MLKNSKAINIELLGFRGCPNTPKMRENLAAALESMGGGLAFEEIDQESLPDTDMRRGWPTPTVLVNGRDLFGMNHPTSPSMGCRIYPDGLPSALQISQVLCSVA